MTLRKRYHELMETIQLTEEMRQRVLKNVQRADLQHSAKARRFLHTKRYLALVSCVAVVFVGALVVPKLVQPPVTDLSAQVIPEITQYDSAQALSEAVGFPITDVTALPFTVTEQTYTSYWDSLGEIEYVGADGQRAVYRKSIGTEDNTGDYTAYEETVSLSINAVDVTLKGTGETYVLAYWTDGEYAYSISLSTGIRAADWTFILQNAEGLVR